MKAVAVRLRGRADAPRQFDDDIRLTRQSAAQAPASPNGRRIAADKRPGPVLHVILAPPEREREAEAPQPRLDLLLGELERVTPVLEFIARAQPFSLVDERLAREWLRLSRRVDKLHEQIRARPPLAPRLDRAHPEPHDRPPAHEGDAA